MPHPNERVELERKLRTLGEWSVNAAAPARRLLKVACLV